jgi:FtsH-binding integral membrane protein
VKTLLIEALQENSSGRGSSKRLTLVAASFSMSMSLIILSIAALMGKDVAAALLAVAGPLGAMSGYGYVHKDEKKEQ